VPIADIRLDRSELSQLGPLWGSVASFRRCIMDNENSRIYEVKDLTVPQNVADSFLEFRNGMNLAILNISMDVYLDFGASGDVRNSVVSLERDTESELSKTCENILSQKLNTDVSIVASDGSVFECHKCFLSGEISFMKYLNFIFTYIVLQLLILNFAVNSTVFAAMLDSDMEEKKTSRVHLEDVSAECVKALLEYLYTFKISEGGKCSKLAVELFQVAHKYHVRQLEQGIGKILLNQVNTWYDVDAALQLFQFARNVEEHKGLRVKCVQVLQL